MELEGTVTKVPEQIETAVDLVASYGRTITVVDQATLQVASEMLGKIAAIKKEVISYWQPLKEAAHKTWKGICDKENQMVTPIATAERSIKDRVDSYVMEERAKARAIEAEAARRQKEAADALLAAAQKADAEGDAFMADLNLDLAANIETAPAFVAQPAKASGISTSYVWEAVVTDPSLVPIEVGGIVLRTIDQSALNNYAKLTKGQGKIPGVVFREKPITRTLGR